MANRPKLQAHTPRHFGGEGLTLSNLVVAQYPDVPVVLEALSSSRTGACSARTTVFEKRWQGSPAAMAAPMVG